MPPHPVDFVQPPSLDLRRQGICIMSRNLILSRDSPWNTNYCTPEGQVLFQAECPYMWKDRVTVRRVVPGDLNDEHGGLKDQYEDIALIDCPDFDTDKITYRGEEQKATHFFEKKGWSFYGRYARRVQVLD